MTAKPKKKLIAGAILARVDAMICGRPSASRFSRLCGTMVAMSFPLLTPSRRA